MLQKPDDVQEISPKERIYSITEKIGFKIYLGKAPFNTVIFSPNGEQLGGISKIKVVSDAKESLTEVELKGYANIITWEECASLLKNAEQKGDK